MQRAESRSSTSVEPVVPRASARGATTTTAAKSGHDDTRRDAHTRVVRAGGCERCKGSFKSEVVGRAYVGLGANLGDRAAMLTRALELLGARPGIRIDAVSSFRETDPVGYLEQPPFLNAAAAIETSLAPEDLLEALLDVERELGRTREGPRFGPRTIDLDLLLVDGVTLESPG